MFGRNKKITKLKEEIASLKSQKEEQEEEIEELKYTIEENAKEIDFLKSEKAHIARERDKLSGEASELRIRNEQLESLERVQDINEALTKKEKQHTEKINELGNEIASWMKKVETLEAQLYILTHNPESIAEELSTLKTENKRLQTALTKMENVYKKELGKLFSKYIKFEVVDSCQVRYKVNYSEKGKTAYPLPADVRIITVMYFSRVGDIITFERKEASMYFLDCVYWPHGGYASFLDNPPRLYMGKPIKATNHRNDECTITLTDERVPETQAEINRLNSKKRFIENKEKEAQNIISRLCSDTAAALPEFTEALTEYEHTLNKQIADFLSSKKHPAISSSEKIKELSKKNKDLEKKFYTLQFDYNILKRKFDELNSKSKNSDSDEAKEETNP